jgi:hypothetical protein
MQLPNKQSPAPPVADGNRAEEVAITDNAENKAEHRGGQLIDRHGHLHSESVLTAWSPTMLKIMGIRRVGEST